MSRPTQLRLGGLDTPKPQKVPSPPVLRERRPGERCGLCSFAGLHHPDDPLCQCLNGAKTGQGELFKVPMVPVGEWCDKYVESGRHEGAE